MLQIAQSLSQLWIRQGRMPTLSAQPKLQATKQQPPSLSRKVRNLNKILLDYTQRLCSDKQWVIFSGDMVFCQSHDATGGLSPSGGGNLWRLENILMVRAFIAFIGSDTRPGSTNLVWSGINVHLSTPIRTESATCLNTQTLSQVSRTFGGYITGDYWSLHEL